MKVTNFIFLRAVLASAGIMSACQPKSETINNYFDSGRVTKQNEDLVEGTINGGGGKGIRCVDPVTGKAKLQLLDLYEAHVLYGLDSLQSPATKEDALVLFGEKMATHFWNPSTINLEEFKRLFRERFEIFFDKNVRYISQGKKLKPVNDAFEPLVDSNCELVQIAVYYDESIILIDQQLWNELSWLDRVALYAHEVLYGQDRRNGVTNSISVRKLVGQMFSTKGARPKADGVPTDESKYGTCNIINDNNITIGYAYAWKSIQDSEDADSEGVEFVFNFFEYKTNLFRTSAFFKYLSWQNFFDTDYRFQATSPLYVVSYFNSDNRVKEVTIQLRGSGNGKFRSYNELTGDYAEYNLFCTAPRTNSN